MMLKAQIPSDKNLLFLERTIEKFPLSVKEKTTTTYGASGSGLFLSGLDPGATEDIEPRMALSEPEAGS